MIRSNITTGEIEFHRTFKSRKAVKNIVKNSIKIIHPVALKRTRGYSLFELEALEDWQKQCVRQKKPFVNPNTREVIDTKNLFTPENEAERILFRIRANDFKTV
jgi:hypothetical protein